MSSTAHPLQARIEKMNDFQLLRFFDYFTNEVFRGLHTSLEEIMGSMPVDQQLLPEVLATQRLDDALSAQAIPKAEAARFARNTLHSWAETTPFSELLENALNQYRDTEQSADVILAVGAAVSMVLLTFGHCNFQLQAFGVSISFNRNQTPEKSDLSQAFNTLPETKQKLLSQSKPSLVTDLLKKGEIAKALELLENTPGFEQKNEITLLQSRYRQWEKAKMLNLHDSEDAAQKEYNRIVYAITCIESWI